MSTLTMVLGMKSGLQMRNRQLDLISSIGSRSPISPSLRSELERFLQVRSSLSGMMPLHGIADLSRCEPNAKGSGPILCRAGLGDASCGLANGQTRQER